MSFLSGYVWKFPFIYIIVVSKLVIRDLKNLKSNKNNSTSIKLLNFFLIRPTKSNKLNAPLKSSSSPSKKKKFSISFKLREWVFEPINRFSKTHFRFCPVVLIRRSSKSLWHIGQILTRKQQIEFVFYGEVISDGDANLGISSEWLEHLERNRATTSMTCKP